jgi:hypothetical protein
MAEAKGAYELYVAEWVREEAERVEIEGGNPEPVQPWPEFFAEYLYAELENSVYVNTANAAIADEYR